MSRRDFLWISEADVCDLMDIGDAIRAVEIGLNAEARGDAANMHKTHVAWDGGTLHAIGAIAPVIVSAAFSASALRPCIHRAYAMKCRLCT